MKGVIFSTGNLGRIYHNLSDFNKAIEYYEKSIFISDSSKNKKYLSAFLASLGIVYSLSGDDVNALEYGRKALNAANETGDRRDKARALSNLGQSNTNQGNFEIALKQLKEALSIAKEIGDKRGLAFRFGHIGNLQMKRGLLEEAIKNHKQGLEAAMFAGARKLEAERLYSISLVNYYKDNVDMAIEKLNIANVISIEIEYWVLNYQIRCLQASCFLSLDQVDEAMKFLPQIDIYDASYNFILWGFVKLKKDDYGEARHIFHQLLGLKRNKQSKVDLLFHKEMAKLTLIMTNSDSTDLVKPILENIEQIKTNTKNKVIHYMSRKLLLILRSIFDDESDKIVLINDYLTRLGS